MWAFAAFDADTMSSVGGTSPGSQEDLCVSSGLMGKNGEEIRVSLPARVELSGGGGGGEGGGGKAETLNPAPSTGKPKPFNRKP